MTEKWLNRTLNISVIKQTEHFQQALDVETTSTRRHDVALALIQLCFKVVCLLGLKGKGARIYENLLPCLMLRGLLF